VTPLAVLTMQGIAADRYERLKEAAQHELGSPLTGNEGTVSDRGVEVSYAYDGSSLTMNVLKVPKIFGHDIISPEAVQAKLMDWVDSVS